MSTASPTAFLLWAILSVLFLIFLVHHLWSYDKFKCLRWSAGRQPGAFKRVMTYSYLGAVPLFAIYSIGMTVIKYREGFMIAPDGTFMPRLVDMYQEPNRSWVLPLQFVFSFAWALEQVTHLEELAFWLYLLHQNPNKEAWFSSWEYRMWYLGSLLAVIGMPLTAVITRNQLQTCDAYIFLVGAAGSTSTTILFLYVLWRFPRFIRHVKAEGAEPTVVVRLATFYQLNQVRVVFRFLFTLPLLVLALDGIIGSSHPVNRNLFLTDFLQMVAGLGCFVSSMITLLIFFPRSIVREAGYKPKLSSTLPTSPKSPPITPPSRSGPFSSHGPPNIHQLPMHVVGVPSGRPGVFPPTATETAATGYTTWDMEESAYTGSMYSPRGSTYESPQYTAEDYSVAAPGDHAVQRRGSRVSRHGSSRRVSAYNPLDVHREQDSDADDEQERGADADVLTEESVPPYSHAQSQPLSQPQPQSQPQSQPPSRLPPPQQPPQPPQPTQARLHQRHPFPHSVSSPQIIAAAIAGAQQPQQPGNAPAPNVSPPPAAPPPSTAVRSSSPSGKRRTWGWEEARHAPFPLGVSPGGHNGHDAGPRSGLTVVASGPGPTTVGVGPGGNVGLGMVVARNSRRVSNLHPYVVNFTSPIDLVDVPPLDELPRSM
ncbi:hypothetical protein C8Q77DRAFT_292355 [Trametes polyzona]|nr:hypothetical protein C8Q77DRAFT_292355 [Trametes polyzona]